MTPLAAALVAFRFHPAPGRLEGVITVFDAAGLGLVCVTGASKVLDYVLPPVPAALMGMVTGVGGGVIRDLVADRVPVILRAGELYAVPALAGSAVVVAARLAELSSLLTTVRGVALCTGWRLVAFRRGWRAPTPGAPT